MIDRKLEIKPINRGLTWTCGRYLSLNHRRPLPKLPEAYDFL